MNNHHERNYWYVSKMLTESEKAFCVTELHST
jgi:hypothetical protein